MAWRPCWLSCLYIVCRVTSGSPAIWILGFLQNSDKNFLFTWVKGYAGVYRNKVADHLAIKATFHNNHFSLPPSTSPQEYVLNWNESWAPFKLFFKFNWIISPLCACGLMWNSLHYLLNSHLVSLFHTHPYIHISIYIFNWISFTFQNLK